MSGEPLGDDARPFVDAMAKEEGRAVLRCTPYATFAIPPRHLHRNDREEKVTHWLSGSVPWDATDPGIVGSRLAHGFEIATAGSLCTFPPPWGCFRNAAALRVDGALS